MDSFWTAERETELAKLWAEGKSAAIIAGIMEAPSRNSVIGKVGRLGLSRTNTQPSVALPRHRPGKPSAPVKADAAPVEAAEPTPVAPAPSAPPAGRCTIMDLRLRSCRYPMWSARETSGVYCGEVTTSEKSSWCREHHAVVFAPRVRA